MKFLFDTKTSFISSPPKRYFRKVLRNIFGEVLIKLSKKITNLDYKLTLDRKEILELHATDHEKTEMVL